MKKSLNKDIFRSFLKSKGRFFSILMLVMLGSFALVGLKVTGPMINEAASSYLNNYHTMDLAVISDWGLSDEDRQDINKLRDHAVIDYGYFTDVVVKDSSQAVRIFSKTEHNSQFELVKGQYPKYKDEIALASFYQGRYQIGDKITFEQSNSALLKEDSYTVVGFVNSTEIISNIELGQASSGSGALAFYGLVDQQAFDSEYYTIARLTYSDLAKLNCFSDEYQERLEQYQDELDQLLADNGQKRYELIKSEIKDQIEEGQDKIDQGKKDLQDGQEQLDQAQATLDQQRADLQIKIDAVKQQMLAQGIKEADIIYPAELQAGIDQLDQAQSELDQKKTDYQREAKTGQSDIDQAQSEIDDAQETLMNLSVPTYKTYTRRTIPGGNGYLSVFLSSNGISAVGNLFPVILFAVAILVSMTTMTRFVAEERTNAGVMKALGYSNRHVIRKFLYYGFSASFIGGILGILMGTYLLPKLLETALLSETILPSIKERIYWPISLLALLISVLSACIPAIWIAYKELSESSAQLLLPKPPAKGSSILLEKIPFIWNRLSFINKVTARNMFRYKQRMLMTVIGVAGSVSLLYAGLAMQSSLSGVASYQFGEVIQYDAMVVHKDHLSDQEKEDLFHQLADSAIDQKLPIYSQQMTKEIDGLSDQQQVNLMVSDQANMKGFIQLFDDQSGERMDLPKDGVIVSSKLAKLLKLQVGDSFTLKDDQGLEYTFRLKGIAQMFAGHYVLMNADYYHQAMNHYFESNAHLLKLNNQQAEHVQAVAADFMALDGVKAVIQNTAIINQIDSLVESLNSVMNVLTIATLALAVVILYNLTVINISERIRELSTIKVLGFYNREVTLYIYRETIVLSIIGILLGLIGGRLLHRIILEGVAPDTMQFPLSVSWSVYAIPIGSVLLLICLLGFYVNHHLKKVDMLEALKSVD